ncbi:MAG: Bug family tripartite tricarboxylate transporter substrate binding protein [bacterium]
MNILLKKKVFSLIIIFVLAIVMSVGSSVMAEYPEDTIEFTVPWGPGGGSDTLMRITANYLAEELGIDIAIRNKPGASGTTGLREHLDDPNDGYYLGQVHEGLIVSHHTGVTDLNFDDFEYVGAITNSPQYLAVSNDLPSDFEEFVDYAQNNEVNVGVTMAGVPHAQMAMLENEIDANFNYVGYEGTGERVEALAGEHVDAIVVDYASGYEYVEDDYFQFIAAATEERTSDLPDLETFKELGVDITWNIVRSITVPPDTDPDKIEVLEQALEKVAENPDFKDDLNDAGAEVYYMTSEELTEY